MLIHLMQHGTNLSREIDVHEPLSPVGREQIEKSAQAARILGLRFELVVASPKARSLQTAELMAQATGYPVTHIEVTEAVKAMAPPQKTLDFVAEYQGLDSILIVGHLPSLALVASLLLTGRESLGVAVENGGLTQIDWQGDPGKATLNFHLLPQQLAAIADS